MIRRIPALIVVLILIVFALSNRQGVTLGFWPTDYAATVPLSLAVLLGMAIAFLAGAALVWVETVGLRRRARRAEALAARLQAELAAQALRQPPDPLAALAGTALPATRQPPVAAIAGR